MPYNKLRNLAVLTAILVIFGGLAANHAQASTVKLKKKKTVVATKQFKFKTVRIATVKSEPSELMQEPVSKCLIATVKDLNAKAIKQYGADAAKYGKGHEKALERYKYRLDIAWEAMNNPYCGYGNKTGLADEIHSFKKSIERARGDFLADIGN
jgi:hypothetical protein